MQYVLWTFLSLVAYIGGLVIITRATPPLTIRSFDEGLFMSIAALDILGAMLAFGAFIVTYGLYSGNFPIKVLNFFMLLGIAIIAGRLGFTTYRPRSKVKTQPISRMIVIVYCAFLICIALYCVTLLFTSSTTGA